MRPPMGVLYEEFRARWDEKGRKPWRAISWFIRACVNVVTITLPAADRAIRPGSKWVAKEEEPKRRWKNRTAISSPEAFIWSNGTTRK